MTHYVVVRRDLPLGVLSAQLVHAAGESSPGNLAEGTYAVVLAVPDESALLTLERKLASVSARSVAIREPAPPYGGQLMAIGLAPILKSQGRRLLSSLPLLRDLGGASPSKL